MGKQVYLIYEGDAWLGKSSLVLQGVYEDLDKAIGDILGAMGDAMEFDESHTAESARKMLEEHHQTQGFEYNYLIEVANLNEMFEL